MADRFLTFEHIRKSYGRHRVLDIGNLAFGKGDRVLINGANGSGKSTLLKLIAGISPVNRGRVRRASEIKKKRIAYMPQSEGMYGDLTIRENFAVYGTLYGMGDLVRQPLFKHFGLGGDLGKRFSDLSGGFQRMAVFAALVCIRPHILVLDEPFNGVDAEKRQIMVETLLHRQPDLNLLVAASPKREAPELFNHHLIIEEGKIHGDV